MLNNEVDVYKIFFSYFLCTVFSTWAIQKTSGTLDVFIQRSGRGKYILKDVLEKVNSIMKFFFSIKFH